MYVHTYIHTYIHTYVRTYIGSQMKYRMIYVHIKYVDRNGQANLLVPVHKLTYQDTSHTLP